MVTLKPGPRQNLSDAVFDQLQALILHGDMSPGSPLPSERDLCEMLSVNRGAVREGLKRLAQARLVTIRQGGKTRVADYRNGAGMELLSALMFPPGGGIDREVARSVVEMRSAIAPDVARLCALRGSAANGEALEEIARRMAKVNDVAAWQLLAREFWTELVAGSGNVAYRLAHNLLRESYDRVFGLVTHVLTIEFGDHESYAAVAAAVVAGDTAEAERRTRELTRKGAEKIYALLDRLSINKPKSGGPK